jgi:hypothetical protein
MGARVVVVFIEVDVGVGNVDVVAKVFGGVVAEVEETDVRPRMNPMTPARTTATTNTPRRADVDENLLRKFLCPLH